MVSGASSATTETSPPPGCTNVGWSIDTSSTPSKCVPGARKSYYRCVDQKKVEICYEECGPDGVWKLITCLDANAERDDAPNELLSVTCTYDCPPDLQNKVIYGTRKVISTLCIEGKFNRVVREENQCDPRCKRRIRVECMPGKPCPPCPPGQTGGVCDYCTPGDTRDCRGSTQVCGPDGVFPPCFPPCVPGSRVFCPCSREWLECDPVTGEFPYCRPGCIPGQTIYCPSGEQRICKADCTHDPCPPCPPGGCPPPPCTEECCLGDPVCVERPGEWVCSWAGREIVRVPTPCPEVVREPWPRAMVGVPLELRITSSCQGATNSGTVAVDPPMCDGSYYIIGLRGTVSFQCDSAQLADSEWRMDERAFNIGKTSDDIMTPYVGDGQPGNNPSLRKPRTVHQIMSETEGDAEIKDIRQGLRVRHVYETPSYNKPVNGPGWPDANKREPAYQVSLRTKWRLTGAFQYQRLITYIKCYNNAGQEVECNRCFDPRNGNALNCEACYNRDFMSCPCGTPGCDRPPGPAYTRVFTETPWFTGPTVSIPVEVVGARVLADPVLRNQCTVIPIPVQQVQTVLVPGNGNR